VAVDKGLVSAGGVDGAVVSSAAGSRTLFFSHPDAPGRSNLTVYTSHDDAKTWSASVTIWKGGAAYSDMAMIGSDGCTLGLLFEKDNYASVAFAAITMCHPPASTALKTDERAPPPGSPEWPDGIVSDDPSHGATTRSTRLSVWRTASVVANDFYSTTQAEIRTLPQNSGSLEFLAPFNPAFETSLENNQSLPAFQNLNFGADVALLAYAFRATQVPGMLSLEATHMPNTVWNYQLLPEHKNGSGLQPGWEAALDRILDRAMPLLKSGALKGIFMGDEIMCSHIPYANFSAVATIVRKKLQGTQALMYLNECTQPFVRTGVSESWTIPSKLPPELDLISIDSYVGRNLCDGDPAKELEVFKTFLEEQIRPRLQEHQRVLRVPGLFGDRNTKRSGSMAEQEDYLLTKLEHYYNYAQSEPLIAGMIPWHWSSPPATYTIYSTVYGLGIDSFPKLVERLGEIGEAIRHPPFKTDEQNIESDTQTENYSCSELPPDGGSVISPLIYSALPTMKHDDTTAQWRQSHFIISMWAPPPATLDRADLDTRTAEVAAANFTTILDACCVPTLAAVQARIDACERAGLTVIAARVNAHPQAIPAVRDSPALLGWQLKDEPFYDQFGAITDYLRDVRAAHPTKLGFINLLPNDASGWCSAHASNCSAANITYDQYVRRFVADVRPQVLCADHYPFFWPARELPRLERVYDHGLIDEGGAVIFMPPCLVSIWRLAEPLIYIQGCMK
jgi:hypothetical protein